MMTSPSPRNETSSAPARRPAGWWRPAAAWTLVVFGLAFVSYPFLPAARYAVARPQPTIPYVTRLTPDSPVMKSQASLPVIANKPVPQDNRLVIPSIGVDMPILEGQDQSVLDRGGLWHIPNTSDPVKGGNMVVSGHRWRYLPPSSMTLYLLDKVKDGDLVVVYWQGQEYDYTISGREIVDPTRTDILDDSEQARLTIFTCTPLFSTKQRLVLYGQLIP